MLTSSRGSSRVLQLVAVAALIVTVRLPFLLRADRFFDSDEAVEGLMARHVVRGEFPVYLWGQHYKGVPEVYLATAIFALAGPTVPALKSATLVSFVLFACLQFLLIRELFSSRVAWVSTALLALGPPSLVLWSLSANAEIVMTFIAGAWLGIALVRWQRSSSLVALGVAGAALGFGLWVQQYIVYYVVALAVTLVLMRPDRGRRLPVLLPASTSIWLRIVWCAALTIAAIYIVGGAISFASGGFDVAIGSATIGMKSPQKLWRLGGVLLIAAGGIGWIARLAQPEGSTLRRPTAAVVIGFLFGYAPALVASFQGGRRPPVPRMDLNDLRAIAAPIVRDVFPVLLGFRSPTTEWFGVSPWFALLFVTLAAISYAAIYTRGGNPFFHVLLLVVPLLFIASGSYIDAQSYRYLMPMYAAIPLVLAIGIDAVWRSSAAAAVLVCVGVLAVWSVEQMQWYERLAPDTKAPAAIACLRRSAARGALADYWVSYKLTFLMEEQVIVAPLNAFDRYPPYTKFVRSLGLGAEQPCNSLLLQ